MKTLKGLTKYLKKINFKIEYEEWVKLVNNLKKEELQNLQDFDDIISEEIAEQLDTSNIPILKAFTNKLWNNLSKDFKLGKPNNHTYILSPTEDGGIYSESCDCFDFDFGTIKEYMATECPLSLKIDFRPPITAYFELTPLIKEWNSLQWNSLLGEYYHLYFDIDTSTFEIKKPTIE